jgi:hypothetical protein
MPKKRFSETLKEKENGTCETEPKTSGQEARREESERSSQTSTEEVKEK